MKTRRPALLLARTFFGRFFENDLLPPGLPQVQLVIWGIAVLAAPGYMVAFRSGIKYSALGKFSPSRLPDTMLLDQLLFITFGMMALGLVALVIWEGVFPDRRDVRVLGVLPLPVRAHVAGRLAAMGAVAALFSAGMNLPPAVIYGPTLWLHGGAGDPLRAGAAHLAVAGMAGLFVFFLLIAAQGVLLNLFGRRLAQGLGLALQTGFVVLLLQMFLFVPYFAPLVRDEFRSEAAGPMAFFPVTWFLGLYQVLAGSPRTVNPAYPVAAVSATLAVVVFATALLAGSYRRLVRMAIETPSPGSRAPAARLRRAADAIARTLVPDPLQRTIAAFTLRTIARSRSHRMLLAMYVGVAAALVVSATIPVLVGRGPSAFGAPHLAWLSAPLIIYFFTLCGMRVTASIPAEIRANWVFRLHAPDDRMPAIVGGFRVALIAAVVAPLALAAWAGATILWGAHDGTIHALVTAALGVALVDVLLIGFRKIPFACTYFPGKSRVRTMWPFYAIAFSLYAYSLAALEARALRDPLLLAGGLAAIAAVVAVLGVVRRRTLQPPPGLTFVDDDPDAIFAGFSLSEGLAAQAPARRNGI